MENINKFNSMVEMYKLLHEECANSKEFTCNDKKEDISISKKENSSKEVYDVVRKDLLEMKDVLLRNIDCYLDKVAIDENKSKVTKIDKVLASSKSTDGQVGYIFVQENGREYLVETEDMAKNYILSCLCPSQFGFDDMSCVDDSLCNKTSNCNACWNELVDSESYIDKYKIYENISEIIDSNINESIRRIEGQLKCNVGSNAKEKINARRLDLVIEKLKTNTPNIYMYNGGLVIGRETMIKLLVEQQCPSDYYIDDESSKREEPCNCDLEQCSKCWCTEITINKDKKEVRGYDLF